MSGEVFEARMHDVFDRRVAAQEARDGEGVLVELLHADRKGTDTAARKRTDYLCPHPKRRHKPHHEEGIQWAHDRARVLAPTADNSAVGG